MPTTDPKEPPQTPTLAIGQETTSVPTTPPKEDVGSPTCRTISATPFVTAATPPLRTSPLGVATPFDLLFHQGGRVEHTTGRHQQENHPTPIVLFPKEGPHKTQYATCGPSKMNHPSAWGPSPPPPLLRPPAPHSMVYPSASPHYKTRHHKIRHRKPRTSRHCTLCGSCHPLFARLLLPDTRVCAMRVAQADLGAGAACVTSCVAKRLRHRPSTKPVRRPDRRHPTPSRTCEFPIVTYTRLSTQLSFTTLLVRNTPSPPPRTSRMPTDTRLLLSRPAPTRPKTPLAILAALRRMVAAACAGLPIPTPPEVVKGVPTGAEETTRPLIPIQPHGPTVREGPHKAALRRPRRGPTTLPLRSE